MFYIFRIPVDSIIEQDYGRIFRLQLFFTYFISKSRKRVPISDPFQKNDRYQKEERSLSLLIFDAQMLLISQRNLAQLIKKRRTIVELFIVELHWKILWN